MANANRSLVVGNWAEADFGDLAASQLAPFLGDASPRIALNGPAVTVRMASAQALALALNELATNAAKYGALSVDDGRVDLNWSVENDALLVVLWAEHGGPVVVPPSRTGLGSMLIDHGIPGAAVARLFNPDGLTCSIRVPLPRTQT
jgi:two-component system CheB/CheR fusion protein